MDDRISGLRDKTIKARQARELTETGTRFKNELQRRGINDGRPPLPPSETEGGIRRGRTAVPLGGGVRAPAAIGAEPDNIIYPGASSRMDGNVKDRFAGRMGQNSPLSGGFLQDMAGLPNGGRAYDGTKSAWGGSNDGGFMAAMAALVSAIRMNNPGMSAPEILSEVSDMLFPGFAAQAGRGGMAQAGGMFPNAARRAGQAGMARAGGMFPNRKGRGQVRNEQTRPYNDGPDEEVIGLPGTGAGPGSYDPRRPGPR